MSVLEVAQGARVSVMSAPSVFALNAWDLRDICAVLTVGERSFQRTDLGDTIRTLLVPLEDSCDADLVRALIPGLSFISSSLRRHEHGVVVVHCSAGVSRSVSVVAAWLVASRTVGIKSMEDALAQIRKVRPQACPNPGFLRQLALWNSLWSSSPCPAQLRIGFRDALYRSGGHQVLLQQLILLRRWKREARARDRRHEGEEGLVCSSLLACVEKQGESVKGDGILRAADTVDIRCRQCRALLCTSLHVVPDQLIEANGRVIRQPSRALVHCVPTQQMTGAQHTGGYCADKGHLLCAGCSNRIGTFDWRIGQLYNACETDWASLPSFCLNQAKLDFALRSA
ncbi:Dual specificity protein phosphatase 12 [Porphyridium purpureum]|uniref:protein-tyrosine-phosphatase n=1 Tax=Porphyridium purpureum TaxID=35688 RepID=A0A5J4Z6J2_PORPP|nr:Dual specificity protein phosphatase 12 [Porphyridium purpureum]|eukprot:POR3802..scf295_1